MDDDEEEKVNINGEKNIGSVELLPTGTAASNTASKRMEMPAAAPSKSVAVRHNQVTF